MEENCHEEQQEIITKEEEIMVAEVSSETVVTTTTTTTTETVTTFEEIAAEVTGEAINDELVAEEIKSQEDEMSIVSSAFAEQLENVQSQLMALSHLPKTIQSTLDEITKQLQSLIPTKSKQKSAEPENASTNEEKVVTNEGDFSLPFPFARARLFRRCLSARDAINKIKGNLFFTFRSQSDGISSRRTTERNRGTKVRRYNSSWGENYQSRRNSSRNTARAKSAGNGRGTPPDAKRDRGV